jgi:hypothetical protein
MKKLFWILIALIGLALIIYFLKNRTTCTQIESKQLNLEGEAQTLIGYSEIKNDLLYTGISFKEDSTYFNLFGKDTGLISDEFYFGNYLSDSALLVFDQEQYPFLYNPTKDQFVSLRSSISFKDLEVTDIKIEKLGTQHGIFLNKGDSLIFWDLEKDETRTLFSLKELPEENESIKSFDLSGNKILLSVRQACSEECDYAIFLVNTEDNSVKRISTLEGVQQSVKYTPMVNFLDGNNYVTSYFADQNHLLEKSIDGNTSHEWCLGNSLEILSIEAVQGKVYLTILDEKIRKSVASKNGLKNLYSGMSIVTVDLSNKD